jgi:hypothetical protein
MGPLMARTMRQQFGQNWANLKYHLEYHRDNAASTMC